jgi:hypothetical protein
VNVLIIPEDFRKDQYMLRPIVATMLRVKEKTATVRVCMDPLLGGIDQALKWERIEEIIERYKGMVDLFLLCVDRDGVSTRRDVLNTIEQRATESLPAGKQFLAENAWQEIEVWVLAGHQLPSEWVWQEIRAEVHPKELYFLPFAEQRKLLSEPGEGRKTLAQEAARQYPRIRQLCPEVADLEQRIN